MMLDLESLSLYPLVRDIYSGGGSGAGWGRNEHEGIIFETFFCVVI